MNQRRSSSVVRLAASLLCCGFLLEDAVSAATIFQAANSTAVAWEAEDVLAITNSAPTTWQVRTDPTASGGSALYQAGDNKTDISSSFATYAIKFAAPGTYTLYVRWRGDEARTGQDPNGANSYRLANAFGDLPPLDTNFPVSSANNSRVPPAANNYGMIKESGFTYTVTQADVAAGQPLLLEIGTREWGMFIDRFVLSQNDSLTEAEFNGLGNSETDLISQTGTDTFLAFEAERVTRISPGTPTVWQVRNDPTASSTSALYASGDNKTDMSSSFAYYSLKFRTPGTYTLYVRWRGDEARTTQDPNGANSYRPANAFGELGPVDANFPVSSANNSRVPPAANNYGMIKEGGFTLTVSQADVDSGQPLTYMVGTREWGMYIDRFVLSQNADLTEAEFNSLPNSGSGARPSALKAVGSAGLTNVVISFDRALKASSVTPGKFTIAGLQIVAAELDTSTSKDVKLTTSAQTGAAKYDVSITGVEDLAGNAISPGSKVSFTAWQLSPGWVLREIYNVTGTLVSDLQAAANFPDRPDSADYVRSVSIGSDLQVNDYGARLTTYFIPPTAGSYEFYLWADDDAQLFLGGSPDMALASLGGVTNFTSDVMTVLNNLVAGQRVPVQVLFKQGTGNARMALGVRKVGSSEPIETLPALGGAQVATFTNPDAGEILFVSQPTNTSVSAFGHAKFSVSANAKSAGKLFYQWQRNGVDIPEATRPVYVTPVLGTTDSGTKYRVIVSVNGNNSQSQEATLTVTPGNPSPLEPYIGVNFVGGGNNSPGASIGGLEFAGVVPQQHFNNVEGAAILDVPLRNAQGSNTPVLLTVDQAASIANGAGERSADDALLQGYIHNTTNSVVARLSNVPAGTYNLIAYALGFNFNSTYELDAYLEGASVYGTNTVKAQHVGDYLPNPTFKSMQSTNPAARDSGNYIVFENVSPDSQGGLVLTIMNASTNVGVSYHPPLNAFQLVRVVPITLMPTLGLTRQTGGLAVSWGADAVGFRLVTSPVLGATATWSTVPGTPNPIAGAGSTVIPVQGTTAGYFRLMK